MTAPLAHTVWAAEGAAPDRSAWFVHGIMGSQRNWRSFARAFAEARPGYAAVTIDLRHHGESGPRDGGTRIADCVRDLRDLADAIGPPDLLAGHSFGGKVALACAQAGELAPEDLWVLDCPPGGIDEAEAAARPTESGELARVIAAIEAIPMPLERRGAIVELLIEQGLSRGLASWMSTNLVRAPGRDEGYVWAFDLDAIRAMIRDYWRLDFWDWLERPRETPRVHLVRAGRSDRWTAEDRRRLDALATRRLASVHVLTEAGHWLHVDAPEALLTLMTRK